ncbi:hypothetical protein F5146DRAFT_1025492 [Armillaria mellea]|nr:hypothetical protein F5146DRAFT_1025492 [Armillaria mellea]
MSQVFVKVDAHGNILCNCSGGVRAAQYTSHSAKNPGRQFHRCAKSRDEQCGFFIWDDEVVKPMLPSSPPSSPMKRNLSDYLQDSPSIHKRPRIDDSPQSPASFPSTPTSKKKRIDEIVQALGQDDLDVFTSTSHSNFASTSKYTLNPVKQEHDVEDGLATPSSSLPRRMMREAPPSPSRSRVTPSSLLASITNDFSKLAEEIHNLEEHKSSSEATTNLVGRLETENRTLKETLRKYEKDIEE